MKVPKPIRKAIKRAAIRHCKEVNTTLLPAEVAEALLDDWRAHKKIEMELSVLELSMWPEIYED